MTELIITLTYIWNAVPSDAHSQYNRPDIVVRAGGTSIPEMLNKAELAHPGYVALIYEVVQND